MIKDGLVSSSISKSRDIIKKYADEAELVLIGLENQMNIHYAMPVHSMLYDSLRYTKQCKKLENQHRADKDLKNSDDFVRLFKTDKIKPIITLVIYYGEKDWDVSTRLSDMMDISPLFKKFYNDQQIYILQIRDTGTYRFQNQDNHDFFTIIGEFYNDDGKIDMKRIREKYADRDVYWETLAAIGVATGSNKLVKYAYSNKGGCLNMCTVLENLEKQSEKRGELRGEKRGEIRGEIRGEKRSIYKTVNILRKLNVDDAVILEKITEEYKLDNKEAHTFLL